MDVYLSRAIPFSGSFRACYSAVTVCAPPLTRNLYRLTSISYQLNCLIMHPLVIGGVVVIGVVVIATVGWELYERYGEQRGYQYEHPYLRTESPVPRFEEERHEDDDDQGREGPRGQVTKKA